MMNEPRPDVMFSASPAPPKTSNMSPLPYNPMTYLLSVDTTQGATLKSGELSMINISWCFGVLSEERKRRALCPVYHRPLLYIFCATSGMKYLFVPSSLNASFIYSSRTRDVFVCPRYFASCPGVMNDAPFTAAFMSRSMSLAVMAITRYRDGSRYP